MANKSNNILLIDDDPDYAIITENCFNQIDIPYSLQVFNGADSAIQHLINSTSDEDFPDFIFLDVNMPKIDGYEFLNLYKKFNLNKKGKSTKIYMLTNSGDYRFMLKSLSYQFVEDHLI